ncbi:hypothetical protein [Schlesneria sp. DSM 10557]|uniref:hypothetical protein n=1 Tax=Schlesneria sp. DSM 10557 TaxID=3044399 RepID=UPI0035A001C0
MTEKTHVQLEPEQLRVDGSTITVVDARRLHEQLGTGISFDEWLESFATNWEDDPAKFSVTLYLAADGRLKFSEAEAKNRTILDRGPVGEEYRNYLLDRHSPGNSIAGFEWIFKPKGKS